MNILDRASVSAFSPLSLGICVAGILMFVVVVIVRSATTQPSDIGATTAASLTAIPWDHIPSSNNVSDALPATDTVAPIIDLSWATESWMAIASAADGSRWVYGDAWFSCQHIDPVALTYLASVDDPALAVWNQLAPRKQRDIAKECQS